MNVKENNTRRNLLKSLGLGAMAGMVGMYPKAMAEPAKEKPAYLNGLPPLKITNVKAIGLAPSGSNLIVVKVETSEPGLYGLGCATFTQRAFAVITAIEKYLQDFCVGKDVDNIEDMWQAAFVSSYWRNGPVLNNAISGLDQALWDIKGKRANMPVYQLLGGKCRFAIPCYTHASGNTPEAAANQVSSYMEEGYRYVRIQQGGYGGAGISGDPDFKKQGFARDSDQYMDQGKYRRDVPKLFETVRRQCGEEVELLHDIHERLDPIDAINVVKSVEPYHPFFIEDPFSPEQMEWFKE
jgi:mannonate dehydratase